MGNWIEAPQYPDLDPEAFEWFQPDQPAPDRLPLLAEYSVFNKPDGAKQYQVVWRHSEKWRPYPSGQHEAFVNRWAYLPTKSA